MGNIPTLGVFSRFTVGFPPIMCTRPEDFASHIFCTVSVRFIVGIKLSYACSLDHLSFTSRKLRESSSIKIITGGHPLLHSSNPVNPAFPPIIDAALPPSATHPAACLRLLLRKLPGNTGTPSSLKEANNMLWAVNIIAYLINAVVVGGSNFGWWGETNEDVSDANPTFVTPAG